MRKFNRKFLFKKNSSFFLKKIFFEIILPIILHFQKILHFHPFINIISLFINKGPFVIIINLGLFLPKKVSFLRPNFERKNWRTKCTGRRERWSVCRRHRRSRARWLGFGRVTSPMWSSPWMIVGPSWLLSSRASSRLPRPIISSPRQGFGPILFLWRLGFMIC